MISVIASLESLLNWIFLADHWSNYVCLGAFALIVTLVRFFDVLSYPEKPCVTYMQKTASGKNHISIGDVLDRCPILNEMSVYCLFFDSSLNIAELLG